MEWDDERPDDEPANLPLPPDDRLWRHPSEVSAEDALPRRPSRGNSRVVTVAALTSCLSVLITLGVVAVVRPFATGGDRSDPEAASPALKLASLTDVAEVTSLVRAAIVQVVATPTSGGAIHGSGVVYREDGVVLTSDHVVRDSTAVRVVLDDGRDLVARIVGRDPDTDIAVLDIDGDGFPVATMATSRASLKIGQPAITIGASGGVAGSPLVRVSMVSAMNQEAGVDGRRFVDMIRTDGMMAPACAGGAVVDADGSVIGIALANGQTDSGEVGFAVPIDVARSVADQLLDSGRVTRGWLGIEGETGAGGAAVRTVSGDSPAERAGLRPGDVIVAVDDVPVATMAALVVKLRWSHVGDVLRLDVARSGERIALTATLGDRPLSD